MAYQSFRENGWVLISIVKEIFVDYCFHSNMLAKKLSVLFFGTIIFQRLLFYTQYWKLLFFSASFLHSKLEGHQFALTMQNY